MHMSLILLALCLRKPNGISHLFSMTYTFAGNSWRVGNKTGVRPRPCPLQNRLNWGHFTRFSGRDNYPQRRGTRPFEFANSIRGFCETVPCSHHTTGLDCIAGFGLLTVGRVRYITSPLSWRPAVREALGPMALPRVTRPALRSDVRTRREDPDAEAPHTVPLYALARLRESRPRLNSG